MSDSNLLTVEDAMQQVLDYFDLLRSADRSLDDKETVVWRLKSVTTNSPFTVTAEPFGRDPSVNVDRYAGAVKKRFYDGIDAVINNKDIPSWIENDKHLTNTLKRNLNGIGRTDIDLGENIEPILISHKVADEARKNLERRKLKETEDFTHTSHGAVEGEITSASTHFRKPCFSLKPRLGGDDIKCIVSQDLVNDIGTAHSLDEVWQNQRVIVEGLVSYNAKGDAINIDVYDIKKVSGKDVDLQRYIDEDFTDKMSSDDYLEKLREGNLDGTI